MKLLMSKWYIFLSLIVVGCTSEGIPGTNDEPGNPIHQVTVLMEGGDPQVYINKCGEEQKVLKGSVITTFIREGYTITATAFSYSEDNSNNYGAPDVHVDSKITIMVDNKIVDSGKEMVSYYIIPAKYK